MRNTRTYRRLTLVTPLIVVLAISIGNLWAHGDKEDEDDQPAISMPPHPDLEQKYNDLLATINVDYLKVKPIFQKSCFDCHSKQTVYPWYHKLPLVGGFLDGHIEHGLEHVDMTNDFPFGGKDSLVAILRTMKEEIEEGEMPICAYRMMHWGMLIEGADQDSVFAWIDGAIDQLNRFVWTGEVADSTGR